MIAQKIRLLIVMLLMSFPALLWATPDVMTITVESDAGIFHRRTFTNGALLYTNRIYTLVNTCPDFEGFDFLASNGSIADTGTIIPSTSGFIYILAKSGGLTGWTEIANSQSMILTVALSIYQKSVVAGERITIPNVTNFQGATPIAKRIKYGPPTVLIKGELIDIKDSTNVSDYAFAQNETYTINSIPAFLAKRNCAFSTSDRMGISQFSCDDTCTVYMALNNRPTVLNGWVNTGYVLILNKLVASIPVSIVNYYVYKYKYTVPGTIVNGLQPISGDPKSSFFFADRLKCTGTPILPGAMITRSLEPKKMFITNPSITILPDGDYLASCTGAYRVTGTSAGVSFFLSTDKGLTWKAQSINNGVMSYENLFVHNGTLYIMGTSGVQSDVIIRKSTDKGITWTYPTNETDGILLVGQFHSAPVPMLIHNGRIWRAFETNVEGANKTAFVMSAPVDADLMKASNWTSTNQLSYQTNWISGNGKSFNQWLEGNTVVDRTGNIVNILRIDEEEIGGVAAIATVTGTTQISFNPTSGIINFPGGGKKFTIRYDSVSDKYWTITNAEFDEDRTKTQAGIYSAGIHCGLLRNRLVLMYSTDLRYWVVKDTLISDSNPFLHGSHYLDWQFDGNDIVAVSRTAIEDERGLPVRQHDANYFIFHRFGNFRTKVTTRIPDTKDEDEKIFVQNKKINIEGHNSSPYSIIIQDILGRNIYKTEKKSNSSIDVSGWQSGVYIVSVMNGRHSIRMKIQL